MLHISAYDHCFSKIYAGLSVGAMSMATSTIVKSIVSKIVAPSEIGTVFSLVSSMDSVVPIVVGPGLTELYNYAIDYFPGNYTGLVMTS